MACVFVHPSDDLAIDGRRDGVTNSAHGVLMEFTMSFLHAIFVVMPMFMTLQIAQTLLGIALTQRRARDIKRELFEPGRASDVQGKL